MASLQRDTDRCCELGRAAHHRLLVRLDAAAAEGTLVADAPTLLDGWTRAVLITHLARNADGHRRMIEGAAQGRIREQYEGGIEGRNAGIEAGRGRTAHEVVADLRLAIERLEAAWAGTDWIGAGRRTLTRETPITELPFLRLREVELHHVDLDLDHGFADVDPTYLRMELRRLEMLWMARQPMGMSSLPAAVLELAPHVRLAWLTGRVEIDGVQPARLF